MANLEDLPVKKKKADRKWHVPDDELREAVKLHAMVGTPQETIGKMLRITPKTLRKHYRHELDFGLADANAKACGKLFGNVMDGKEASIFFWLKTRAGFKEAKDTDASIDNAEVLTATISKLIDKLPN